MMHVWAYCATVQSAKVVAQGHPDHIGQGPDEKNPLYLDLSNLNSFICENATK